MRRTSCLLFAIPCFLLILRTGPVSSAQPTTQPVDTINPNDLLCIGIWDIRPTGGETLKTVRVDPKGYVSLYYVGQVKLAGKTFEQAEREINDVYRANNVTNNAAPSLNRLENGATASVQYGLIGVGERISVRVLDLVPDVEQCRVFTVSEGGKVGLPLLGQFKVAGMNEADAEAAITRSFEVQFGLHNVPVSILRLGPRQESEPTTASEPNSRPTQQVLQRRR
jgi:protein involved in polysaccharide export with SLBB domain